MSIYFGAQQAKAEPNPSAHNFDFGFDFDSTSGSGRAYNAVSPSLNLLNASFRRSLSVGVRVFSSTEKGSMLRMIRFGISNLQR